MALKLCRCLGPAERSGRVSCTRSWCLRNPSLPRAVTLRSRPQNTQSRPSPSRSPWWPPPCAPFQTENCEVPALLPPSERHTAIPNVHTSPSPSRPPLRRVLALHTHPYPGFWEHGACLGFSTHPQLLRDSPSEHAPGLSLPCPPLPGDGGGFTLGPKAASKSQLPASLTPGHSGVPFTQARLVLPLPPTGPAFPGSAHSGFVCH